MTRELGFYISIAVTKQLNVVLPENEVRRIKKDAVEMGVTLNQYALQALTQFLSRNSIAQRRGQFAGKRKSTGRKVAL